MKNKTRLVVEIILIILGFFLINHFVVAKYQNELNEIHKYHPTDDIYNNGINEKLNFEKAFFFFMFLILILGYYLIKFGNRLLKQKKENQVDNIAIDRQIFVSKLFGIAAVSLFFLILIGINIDNNLYAGYMFSIWLICFFGFSPYITLKGISDEFSFTFCFKFVAISLVAIVIMALFHLPSSFAIILGGTPIFRMYILKWNDISKKIGL